MRKSGFLILLAAIWLGFSGGVYGATLGGPLQVSATSIPACTIVITDITFPGFDGSTDVGALGEITVNCPLGTPYNIALDAGLYFDGTYRHVVDLPSAEVVPYLLLTAPSLAEWGDSDFANTFPLGTSVPGIGTGVFPGDVYFIDGLLLATLTVVPPAGVTFTDIVQVTLHY
jgi:spore coat protein U-like protein